MAASWYTAGLAAMDGSFDMNTSTLKLMLLKNSYTFNPDDASLTPLAAVECDATNYVGGFGGAGRKTVTVTSQQNDTNNRRDWAISDTTWTALGGATNNTLEAAALVFELTNDAASIPVVYFDFSGGDFTTNGSDVLLDFLALGSGGNARIAV